MQIYENVSREKYQTLVGMTLRMFQEGKTPEEISIKIKQPIEKVNECIVMIKKAKENPSIIRKLDK